ncbi:hypothetical protein D9M68_732760 [compost metagenome]
MLSSLAWPWNRPRLISHFLPKPGVRLMAKPASFSARRTKPAAVKVASVVPGPESRASWAKSAGLHMSGFFAGANPSRNQASMRASSSGRHSRASPTSRVSTTRPAARLMRWKPGCTATYCSSNWVASGASSGQRARARCRSPRARGNFSTLTKCSRASAGAQRSNSCQAQRKFSPVPKPVSPMVSRPPAGSSAKRRARSLPSRKTCRVSSMPEAGEK